MEKRVCLRKRDIKFMMFLGEYGIIANENVKMFYNSEYYYKNRLASLAKGEMVERLYGKVVLGRKGKSYLNKKGFYCRNINRNESYKKRVERISNIACKVTMAGWYFEPSWRCSVNIYTQRGNRFVGVMSREKKSKLEGDETFYKRSYIVYFLHKDITPRELKYIDKEIDRNKRNFKGLIVFTEDEKYLYKPKFVDIQYEDTFTMLYDSNAFKVLKIIKDETEMGRRVCNIYGDEIVSMRDNSFYDEYCIKKDGYKTFIYYMPFANFNLLDILNVVSKRDIEEHIKYEVVCLKTCVEYVRKFLVDVVDVVCMEVE